jgi:hypothetical protein
MKKCSYEIKKRIGIGAEESGFSKLCSSKFDNSYHQSIPNYFDNEVQMLLQSSTK